MIIANTILMIIIDDIIFFVFLFHFINNTSARNCTIILSKECPLA